MQYTDNEAALIGGLISNYFFQPSVDETLRIKNRRSAESQQINDLPLHRSGRFAMFSLR